MGWGGRSCATPRWCLQFTLKTLGYTGISVHNFPHQYQYQYQHQYQHQYQYQCRYQGKARGKGKGGSWEMKLSPHEMAYVWLC